jgi:hypothetical protein
LADIWSSAYISGSHWSILLPLFSLRKINILWFPLLTLIKMSRLKWMDVLSMSICVQALADLAWSLFSKFDL